MGGWPWTGRCTRPARTPQGGEKANDQGSSHGCCCNAGRRCRRRPQRPGRRRSDGLAGIGFVGYGAIFFILNFTDQFLELGITQNEVPVARADIVTFSPELFHYISHLHIAIAGMLVAIGIGVAALAWIGVRARRESWAWWTAVTLPVVTLAIALPAHYPNNLDTLGHLGLIYLATAVFVVGALMSLPVARRPD